MSMEGLSISKKIKNKIIAPVPDDLIMQREGGGKTVLSYLSGSTITDMLNDTFGYIWTWKVKEQWIQESQPAVNKYINGKFERDSSKWTIEPQAPVAHVLGTLTVYLKDEDTNQTFEISKDGFGSKSIIGKQSEQESIFKAAGTDALKKAASLFGIGLELYRNDNEKAYFYEINYEDPWTDELIAEKQEQRDYLKNYIEQYAVSEEDFDNYVYEVTGGTSYAVTPDNIDLIVNSIKEGLAGEE